MSPDEVVENLRNVRRPYIYTIHINIYTYTFMYMYITETHIHAPYTCIDKTKTSQNHIIINLSAPSHAQLLGDHADEHAVFPLLAVHVNVNYALVHLDSRPLGSGTLAAGI